MSIRYFIHFFRQYKYFAIFPVAVIEGPIISIITGFLASRGVVSFFGGFLAVFLGDFISDTVFYLIGRKGKAFVMRLKFLRMTDAKIQTVEDQYERAPWKTMILAKVSYGLGTPFMISTGLSKMSLRSFLGYMGILNAIRSMLLVILGYYFGRLALRATQKYLGWYTLAVIILVPTLWYIFKKVRNRKTSANVKHT